VAAGGQFAMAADKLLQSLNLKRCHPPTKDSSSRSSSSVAAGGGRPRRARRLARDRLGTADRRRLRRPLKRYVARVQDTQRYQMWHELG
jgi:hypothetical protein